MHKPLLRELPGFSDRIENNSYLIEEISSCLDNVDIKPIIDNDNIIFIISIALKNAKFEINEDGKVVIDDRELLAQSIFDEIESKIESNLTFDVQNKLEVSFEILNAVTNFVNENYTQR